MWPRLHCLLQSACSYLSYGYTSKVDLILLFGDMFDQWRANSSDKARRFTWQSQTLINGPRGRLEEGQLCMNVRQHFLGVGKDSKLRFFCLCQSIFEPLSVIELIFLFQSICWGSVFFSLSLSLLCCTSCELKDLYTIQPMGTRNNRGGQGVCLIREMKNNNKKKIIGIAHV